MPSEFRKGKISNIRRKKNYFGIDYRSCYIIDYPKGVPAERTSQFENEYGGKRIISELIIVPVISLITPKGVPAERTSQFENEK